MEEFAKKIRKLRIRMSRNMSQKDLADLLNVDRTTVAGWETKDRMPDVFLLIRIADIFDTTLDELVGRE